MKSKTKLFSLASAAALGLVSCATDEVQEVYSGEEIRFTTQVSRATPTDLAALDGFYVYADADGYSSLFIDGMTATKKTPNSDDYVLESKVTWPVDIKNISFWAYGPLNAKINPSITATSQQLRNFEVKSDLENGGKDHQDLVVTYTNIAREDAKGMQVPLQFHHALSQIEVKIKKGEGFEVGRVVRVKGAWIVNAHSKGNLDFDFNSPDNHMRWITEGAATFGRKIEPSPLGVYGINMISNEANGGKNSSLMLPPQAFVPAKFGNSPAAVDEPVADEGSVLTLNDEGTYILVLCRIETEHYTDPWEAGLQENPAIKDLYNAADEKIGHVHQLFPVVKNEEGQLIYKDEAYGYTCVPIGGEWHPGKKYVYTLEFCGKSSGAGVYPPESLPEGLPEGTPRPDGKEPGDPVLDNPITFKVSVSDWTDDSGTIPMN